MSQIASLYAKLGFSIDKKGLKEFEKKLQQVGTKQDRRYRDEAKNARDSAQVRKRADNEAHRAKMHNLRQETAELERQDASETLSHNRRMRELRQENRVMRQGKRSAAGGGMSYRGAREYGRAWIPGLGGAFAAMASTQSYQGYVGTQAGLTAATGTPEQAEKEFKFLEQLSQKLGVFVGDMAKSFTSLSANTRNTSLEGQGTRDVFEAVASYSRVLNLSAADQDGVFRALTQMVGKGQVYAEELRQQMGERLPGSFQAMARASGFGDDEEGVTAFYKAVEAGEIKATEVFPKFAEELMKMANEGGALEKAMNNTAAAIGRFRTNVYLANKTINESGYDDAVRSLMNRSSEAINRSTPFWDLLGTAIEQAGKAVEVPIEMFGALNERLPVVLDFIERNATGFKILGAAVTIALAPLRNLFLLIYGVASLSDILLDPGRERSWAEWAVQIGLAGGALLVMLGTLKSILKFGNKVSTLFKGGLGGAAATGAGAAGGSAAATAAKMSPILRVTVVGFAITALGALGTLIYDAFKNGVSSETGNSFQRKQADLSLPSKATGKLPEWMTKTLEPQLNSSGGISAGQLPLGPPVVRSKLLDDGNIDAWISQQQAKNSSSVNQSNEITINIASDDPKTAGEAAVDAIKGYFTDTLRSASSSQQVTEK